MPRKKAESKTALKTVKKATTRKKSSAKAIAQPEAEVAASPEAKPATKAAAKTVAKTTAKTTAKTAAKSPAKAAKTAKTTAKTAAKSPAKAAKTAVKPGRRTRTKSSALAAAKTAAPDTSVDTDSPVATSTDEAPAGEPLTGKELLKKVKELGNNLSKEDKAKACGYYAVTKNGMERVNMMKFLNALIDAEGIDLDGKSGESNGRGGRSASYKITVQSNGNLLIGAAYTKKMDLKPGDEFKITLGRKHIRLTQVEED